MKKRSARPIIESDSSSQTDAKNAEKNYLWNKQILRKKSKISCVYPD